ncbi:hypothetical protein OESDEN_12138 [Oesophagostomum dentatum]|uniref:Uncharacterized protein n=1 Tax=Oesophagostomum dentatum TaxID=61180 RepID=A0A0B1ST00_OESDE|nr:hypothetical protein OESDEN_12138 [Oesophagostomum dentatum]
MTDALSYISSRQQNIVDCQRNAYFNSTGPIAREKGYNSITTERSTQLPCGKSSSFEFCSFFSQLINAAYRYGDDKGWESQAGNKMFDEVHQMQGLTLEVLEKLTKTYEEMQKTNEEMKQALKNMREAMAKSTVTESTSAWTTGTTTATPSVLSSVARSTTTNMSTTTDLHTDSKTREASSEDDEDDGHSQPEVTRRKK